MRHLVAAIYFALLPVAQCACASARVTRVNGVDLEQPVEFETFGDAFNRTLVRDDAFSWRVVTAFRARHWTTVEATPRKGTASWRVAVSDGDGEFHSLTTRRTQATVPPGDYGVTVDVLSPSDVNPPPLVVLKAIDASWDACGSTSVPEPACSIGPNAQAWGQEAHGAAASVSFGVRAAVGVHEIVGVTLMLSHPANVTLFVSGEEVGRAQGSGTLTIICTRAIDAGVIPTYFTLNATSEAIVTSSPDASSDPPGDWAYALSDGPRFVGSILSSPMQCAGSFVSASLRASTFVTVALPTSAISVTGWDPNTIPVGMMSVFMTPATDPYIASEEATKALLTIVDGTYPTKLVRISNVATAPLSTSMRQSLRQCVAKALCSTSGCLDRKFANALSFSELVTFNFAKTTLNRASYEDLWIGIQTEFELDGIVVAAGGIRDSVFDCGGLVSPMKEGQSVTSYVGSQGGKQPPTRADIILYATPNTDRDLFRDYAAYIVEKYKEELTASMGSVGILTIGDFTPLAGNTRNADAYTWDFSRNLFIASGAILGLMVLVGGEIWRFLNFR